MLRLDLKNGSFVFLDNIAITIGVTSELDPLNLEDKILKNISVMINRGILVSNMTSSEVAGFIKDEKVLRELERIAGIVPAKKVEEVAPETAHEEEVSTDVSAEVEAVETPEKPTETTDRPKFDNKRKKR